MNDSLDQDLDRMSRDELIVECRRLGAEVRVLRQMREENRRLVADTLVRLGLREPFPPASSFGCPSEQH